MAQHSELPAGQHDIAARLLRAGHDVLLFGLLWAAIGLLAAWLWTRWKFDLAIFTYLHSDAAATSILGVNNARVGLGCTSGADAFAHRSLPVWLVLVALTAYPTAWSLIGSLRRRRARQVSGQSPPARGADRFWNMVGVIFACVSTCRRAFIVLLAGGLAVSIACWIVAARSQSGFPCVVLYHSSHGLAEENRIWEIGPAEDADGRIRVRSAFQFGQDVVPKGESIRLGAWANWGRGLFSYNELLLGHSRSLRRYWLAGWLPAAAFAIPLGILLGLGWLPFWRMRRPGFCRRCGYNLTGNTSGRCPECGELIQPQRGCSSVTADAP